MDVDRNRYKVLPKRIRLEDTIAELDTRAVADPERGHNTDNDFLLRYCML